MPVISSCHVCKRRRRVTRGRSVLDQRPMNYCDECLDHDAEPWNEFYIYAQGVDHKLSKRVLEASVYYHGEYITAVEALEHVPAVLQNGR